MLSADRVREKSPLCFSSDPIVCNLSARALLMKHMEELCSYIAREPRGICCSSCIHPDYLVRGSASDCKYWTAGGVPFCFSDLQ
jgi:hypothetical protein